MKNNNRLIPVTYLSCVVGKYDIVTKVIVFDDINFYKELQKTTNQIGISSRTIGNIIDGKVID